MRRILPVLVVGVLIVLASPVFAAHGEEPIQPAEEPSHAFLAQIYDVNRTIAEVEAKVGNDPAIDDAKHQRALAAQSFMSGNHWVTLQHLWQATYIIERVSAEYDSREASDQEASYFSEKRAAWNEATAIITNVHEDMLELQSEGVDLWMLDHALMAGYLLAKGENLHRSFGPTAEAWEGGDRSEQMRNGLSAFSHGAKMHALLAQGILDRAQANQTDQPIGPVMGNATLRGTVDAIGPVLAEGATGVDREFQGIVEGNLVEEEWLAALGATIAWSENQANVAFQWTFDDGSYDTMDMVHHLEELIENDESMEVIDGLGVPGAQARFSLPQAYAGYHQALNDTEEGEVTHATALQATQALGALSAVHTSAAIMQAASGQTPMDHVVHLPTHSAGSFDLEEMPVQEQDAD